MLDLAVDPSGARVYVTGFGGPATNWERLTAAFSASNGALLWAVQGGSPNIDDTAYSLVVSSDGGTLYLSGRTHSDFVSDWYVAALDADTGGTIWESRAGPPVSDPSDSVLSPDGDSLYLTGAGGPNEDWEILSFDTATGDLRWATAFGNPNSSDFPGRIAVAPDGGQLFVVGNVGADPSWAVVAIDTVDGRIVWTDTRGVPGSSDRAFHVAVSEEGQAVYVTGVADAARLSAYDTVDGHEMWFRIDVPISGLVIGPETGTVFTADGGKNRIAAFDPLTGSLQWTATYPSKSAQLNRLLVSPDEVGLFVIGSDFSRRTGFDAAAAAYSL
jgi:outer membrane protein assembly factor BamB